ncbi:MAG: hypothetical protein V3T86_16220 [Planctomycetota bacterium]
MRPGCLGLLAALAVAATLFAPASAQGVFTAIREFYMIRDRGGDVSRIQTVVSQLAAGYPSCKPDTRKSIRNQVDKGLQKKDHAFEFYRGCADFLCGIGKQGLNKVSKRYSASKRTHAVRLAIAESLTECNKPAAMGILLKISFDKYPPVAAQGIRGVGAYYKCKQEKRKATMKKLIDRYKKVTSAARGKKPDSKELKLYQAVKPALDETLKKLSNGEELDSFEAWASWLSENMTTTWPKPEDMD